MSECGVDGENENLQKQVDDLVSFVDHSCKSGFYGKVHGWIDQQTESFEMRFDSSDVDANVKSLERQGVIWLREHLDQNIDGDFVENQVDVSFSVDWKEAKLGRGFVVADNFQAMEGEGGFGVEPENLKIDVFNIEV